MVVSGISFGVMTPINVFFVFCCCCFFTRIPPPQSVLTYIRMNVTLPPPKKKRKHTKKHLIFQTVSEYSTTERRLDPRTSVSDSPGQGEKGGGSKGGGAPALAGTREYEQSDRKC